MKPDSDPLNSLEQGEPPDVRSGSRWGLDLFGHQAEIQRAVWSHRLVDFGSFRIVELRASERFGIRRDAAAQIERGPADYVARDEEGTICVES